MGRKRIAIACQGGGSQCAFVAGALKALFDRHVHHRFEVVGLSGTSGGALTAALAWKGMLREARGDRTPISDGIVACWRDLTAQTPQEIALDQFCVQMLRLAERGVLPTFANSPASQRFQFWAEMVSRFIGRPEFTDLRALILKHMAFDELPTLVQPDSPVLLVGAGNVLQGTFKIFSSSRGEITADSLMASAAIPSLFPAAWVDGQAYWDGIYAANPPLVEFLREGRARKTKLPEEIWIIQVNRPEHDAVPECPSDIFDVRNHLAGNLSLLHEIQVIDLVNYLLGEGALTEDFRRQFGLEATTAIRIRFIRMSESLRKGLDYPSKLSRQPGHIAQLLQDGEARGHAFLDELEKLPQPTLPPAEVFSSEIH